MLKPVTVTTFISMLGKKMRAEDGLYKGEVSQRAYLSVRDSLTALRKKLHMTEEYELSLQDYLRALFEKIRLEEYIESGAGSSVELLSINHEVNDFEALLDLDNDAISEAHYQARLLAGE